MKKVFLTLLFLCLSLPALAAEKESVYDRAMRTNTIRCGYGISPPWIVQDLKTGKMTGPTANLMEEIGKQLSFKVDWAEDTGWANLPASLIEGRVDVACSMLWVDPARGKQVAYTRPLFYTAINAYARAGDNRFTGKVAEINRPDVKIAVQDGDVNYALAKRYYPKAQLLTLPQTSSWSEVYLSVTTGKADVTFADSTAVSGFNKAQEKKLQRIPLAQPITVYGTALAVSIHETEMKEMLDAAVKYLLDTGRIEEIMHDFTKEYPDAIVMPQKPY